jgi:hypothetical protein
VKDIANRFLSAAHVVIFISFAFTSVAYAFTTVAYADVTLKDVQTIIRTVGFLQTPPASGSVFAVIYNPDSTESTKNARQIETFLSQENKNLRSRLVPVSDLSQVNGAKFSFVTKGLAPYHEKISALMRANQIISFTNDRDCIDRNNCAVYINSVGRVEIVVNKAVATAVKAEFKQVFLMMITVI